MSVRNSRPRGLGSTASATLKRYVFPDSMRPPPAAPSPARFVEKNELPLERCQKFFFFFNTSRTGVVFLAEMAPIRMPTTFFWVSWAGF